MEKSTGAASSASTAPPPKDIVFPSETRLRLHRDYLANWTPLEPPKTWQSTSISDDERWERIDQWKAFPELPSYEEVQGKMKLRRKFKMTGGALGFGLALIMVITSATNAPLNWLDTFVKIAWLDTLVKIAAPIFFLTGLGYLGARWLFDCGAQLTTKGWNSHSSSLDEYWRNYNSTTSIAPHQLFWHLHAPHLFVSRDHRHMTGWRWIEEKSANEKSQYSHKLISDDSVLFSAGDIDKIFFSDSYDSHFLVKSESSYRFYYIVTKYWTIYDCAGCIRASFVTNTWDLHLFGFFRSQGDPHSSPWRPGGQGNEILVFPSSGFLSVCHVSELPESLYFQPRDDYSKIQDFAKATVSLVNIQFSANEFYRSFAWHPSGLYLAIEITGRLYLLHWDSAELVADKQGSEMYEAVAWSPDGSLLAVDRTFSKVWDIRTGKIRPSAPHERWDYREEGSLDNKLQSCDGLRRFSSQYGDPNFPVNLEKVTDIAWSPYDPDVFATIGGKDCPRDIRIWQRVK